MYQPRTPEAYIKEKRKVGLDVEHVYGIYPKHAVYYLNQTFVLVPPDDEIHPLRDHRFVHAVL